MNPATIRPPSDEAPTANAPSPAPEPILRDQRVVPAGAVSPMTARG
jgi:hypothetical protein